MNFMNIIIISHGAPNQLLYNYDTEEGPQNNNNWYTVLYVRE